MNDFLREKPRFTYFLGRHTTITISWNYLHDAIKVYGSYEMTEILLRNGADPNRYD